MSIKSDETAANFESILSGKLPAAELVIGLVGAVGADLTRVVEEIGICLEKYAYSTEVIRVSGLIKQLVEVPGCKTESEVELINALMTAGDNARRNTKNNAILALVAAYQIYGGREVDSGNLPLTRPRQAYVIHSLKHPDEVNALRRIYGNGFFLMGVYVSKEQRRENLIHKKNMSPEDADKLIERDEEEAHDYGQKTRDTFHLSDFFVQLNDDSRTRNALERIFDILFANPYRTPLFDEYAMYMAFAAATRSADLSRQIGAVIAMGDEVLATGVNDCPRAGGGTYWPRLNTDGQVIDEESGRDHKRGCDSNDEEKAEMIEGALKAVRRVWSEAGKAGESPDEELLAKALKRSPIDDITEYGRVVHAEMDALLTCARNNISCRGATIYSTTFPCHNCAKHIIAAGITRVVYIEPYPKSKAFKFHPDAVTAGFRSDLPEDHRVAFEPFVGVGPRRFFDLFSMKQGSGFPLRRKDKHTGKILPWDPQGGIIRMPMLPWHYLQREEFAVNILKPHLRGENDGHRGDDACQAGPTEPGAVDCGDAAGDRKC